MRTYMIQTPRGKLLQETARPAKYWCKASYIGHTSLYWKDLEAQGYRCVRVKITKEKKR